LLGGIWTLCKRRTKFVRGLAVFEPMQIANTIGPAINALALCRIRRLVDECIGMQGFVCFHSCGGGAGADSPIWGYFVDCRS
jgi:hypothetical protein